MSITWYINGTRSTTTTNIQLGIVTNGGGSQQSNLTIPGYPQYNDTEVICIESGSVNGVDHIKSHKAILKIQGNNHNYFASLLISFST